MWGRERFKLKEREKNERKVINWVSGTCEGGSKRDSSGKKEGKKNRGKNKREIKNKEIYFFILWIF